MTIELRIDGDLRQVEPDVLVVVGFTGADEQAVRHHIDELAAEGIAPPARVPMYWAMPASSLTQSPVVEVPSAATSGEIELALIVDGDEVLLAAGSDHTCRAAEAVDIHLSKLICPTPLSVDAMPWSDVAGHWPELVLASSIATGGATEAAEPYQSAPAKGNRPPQELMERIPWADDRPRTFVVLCGTVAAIGGIRPADRFRGSITDPRSGRSIILDYEVRPAPALTEPT